MRYQKLFPNRTRCLQQVLLSTCRPCSLTTHLSKDYNVRTLAIAARRTVNAIPNFNASDKLARFTKDEAITSSFVQVKEPNGRLLPPQQLHSLLRSIKRPDQVVIQLSKPGEQEYAVVEVVETTELLRRIRDQEAQLKQQRQSQKDQKPKQIEVNWAISDNDLDLKLNQLEQFLEKGKRVEVLLATKRKQRRASSDEAETILKKIQNRIEEIGAHEVRPMEGEILKQAMILVKKGDK